MKFHRIWADLRVTLLYALFGGIWILFSDRALETLASDTSTLTILQTYKGWFYVTASALLLFFLLRNETAHRSAAENKLHENEEKYRLLFENSMDAIMLTAPDDGAILSANPAACRLFGMTEQEITRLGWEDFIDVTDPRLQAALEERKRTGKFHGELTFTRRDGFKFEGDVSTVIFKDKDGLSRTSLIIRDITERKKIEEQLVQMKRLYATLSQVNQTIVRVKDRADLYQSICDVSVEYGEFALAWIAILDEKTGDVNPVAASGLDVAQWPFETVNIHTGSLTGGLLASAIRTSQVITSSNVMTDKRTASAKDIIAQYGYKSSSAIPFQVRGKTIGALLLISQKEGIFNAEEEQLLLKEMGGDISFALDTLETEAEHARAEDSLRKSEENFSKAFLSSPAALLITRLADGLFLEVNKAYLSIVGYSRMELIGHKTTEFNIFVNTEDRKAIVERLLATGSVHNFETSIRNRSGEIRHIFASQEIIKFNGDEDCILSSFIDITERKKAELQVQQQLQRLKGLRIIDQSITSSLDIHVILNVVLQQVLNLLKADATAILLLNPSTQTLDYAVGQGFYTKEIEQTSIPLGEGLAGQVGMEQKSLHISDLPAIGDRFIRAEKLKEDHFVQYIGVPLVAKGSIKGVMEIFQRTTTQFDEEWLGFLEALADQAAIAIENAQLFEGLQRSNSELEQRVHSRTTDLLRMNKELEHANHAKDEFLANMSHELRTPLTGILGMTESIQLNTYGQVTKEQVKALKNIETSGTHLLTLINDILDLSKTEAGKLDIYPEMVNVEEVCQTSLIFIKEQARKKSIKVEYQQRVNVKTLFADPRRLKQILINLLSNAVKFTPENGKVTLSVRADLEMEQIHFSVHDNGIGISQENLQRLFTPFTQVDGQLNRQYEGSGLGLALVLRLAEIHGGSVSVESEVGVGSNFTVSLPWQHQPMKQIEQLQPESPADQLAASHGLLLLAEDNEANIEAIAGYLEFHGYTLVVAANGMDALVKAEEHDPQLILMDIQMPVMDGLEAIRRLRADPRFDSTPIIALTALAMTGDRDRCLQAGADEYMSKPASPKKLAMKIAELLQKRYSKNT
jgi:PAS domain S-box-containing protein